MNRLHVTVFVVIFTYLGLVPTNAQRSVNVTYGAGVSTCGKWVATTERRTKQFFVSWVQGFMSGMGVAFDILKTDDPRYAIRQTESEAMTLWMDNYCKEHPLEPIRDAALQLIGELRQKP